MTVLTHRQQLELNHLEHELTQQVALTNELSKEHEAMSKRFSNGEFNSRASFREAREVIDAMKAKRAEIKKSEKKCAIIRQKIATFNQ